MNLTDRVRLKKVLEFFFTGSHKPMTKDEDNEMKSFMRSAPMQEQFCNFLLHTGEPDQELTQRPIHCIYRRVQESKTSNPSV